MFTPPFFPPPNIVSSDTQNLGVYFGTGCPLRTFQSPAFSKTLISENKGNEVLINIVGTPQDLHKLFVVLLRLYLSADCCARWQEGLAGANL